jgi:hypothetical protein
LINFSTNKNSYYIDDTIEINATWDLQYDNTTEISYIQVQIFDNSSTLLWNSSLNEEIGLCDKIWNVSIPDLNISLSGETLNLTIKFRYGYLDISSGSGWNLFLDESEVSISEEQAIEKNPNEDPSEINLFLTLGIIFLSIFIFFTGFLVIIREAFKRINKKHEPIDMKSRIL